tara:strand:+ start:235 stop:594 length:360 start_codon:yes stop_codon:yes gene_type:complete
MDIYTHTTIHVAPEFAFTANPYYNYATKFYITLPSRKIMAKEKKGQGFQSAAGLIRYFDAEDKNALQISRWGVILACILTIIVVEVADAVGRQTSAYILGIGLVIIIMNEFRISRSESV